MSTILSIIWRREGRLISFSVERSAFTVPNVLTILMRRNLVLWRNWTAQAWEIVSNWKIGVCEASLASLPIVAWKGIRSNRRKLLNTYLSYSDLHIWPLANLWKYFCAFFMTPDSATQAVSSTIYSSVVPRPRGGHCDHCPSTSFLVTWLTPFLGSQQDIRLTKRYKRHTQTSILHNIWA